MADLKAKAPGPQRSQRLAGHIALVTGSDSGIGRAIAEELASEGADVAVTYHSDQDGAEETLRGVKGHGRHGIVVKIDVTDEKSVAEAFNKITSELGVPDILINNAGRQTPGTPVIDLETKDFDAVLKTDLYGPFFCCREFIRLRKSADGGGKIVNVTSVHERIPSPQSAAYGAAKGGLLTFTRSLALEVAPLRINVNALAPGQIRTPMTIERIEDPEIHREEMAQIPWHRPGEPWEVARLAAYLVSDEADYITGQSFTIDGGLEMNWGQGA
ncbi:SDR family NAD(P)-dependent oxidoreductase [Consotaella salsifontis]|uniref:Glucose 1-dehydrogenase n=1 Tax=Consotaella salsifontis TaxID=1365950 RepID=A0A1T4SI21_9HYPH|nr:glucose 1-dehydrogenase [Consotaella salsifontis]SKA27786.1 glucose 1-dehydrogenase [Consotaella salsifontis]